MIIMVMILMNNVKRLKIQTINGEASNNEYVRLQLENDKKEKNSTATLLFFFSPFFLPLPFLVELIASKSTR